MNEEPKRPQRGHDLPQAKRPAGVGSARRGEDPLAELARLIGQEDPFAGFEEGAHPPATPAPRVPAGNGGDARIARRESSESRDRTEPRRPLTPLRQQREDDFPLRTQRESDAPDTSRNGRGANAYSRAVRQDRDAPRHDGVRESYRPGLARPLRTEAVHGTATLTRSSPALGRDGRGADTETQKPRDSELPRYARRDRNREGPDEQYQRIHTTEYDPEYADEADLPEHGEEIFDDTEPRRNRRGLAIVAGVLGLAVVGTAGFFGYRAMFGVADSGPPPTIRAESGPVKVVPPGATKQAEAPGQKQIYERLGGPPPANERMVSREERPVDLNQGPRVVTTPVPVAQPNPPVQQPAANPPVQPAANAGAPSTEPRHVRTVSVRADGTIVGEQASRIIPPRAAPNPPLAVNAYANQPGEEPETPPAQVPAPRQSRTQAPWAIVEPGQQPQPPTRTAARSNTPVIEGGYVVQVNSQKTEAEAQAAWRQMQSRYSTVLGSRQASIRRVDLGDRGVFYRAMLGPFANRDQASEVCQSLKTAGGDCIVQRN